MFRSMLSVTQNPRTQASHLQWEEPLLFAPGLLSSLHRQWRPVSSPATLRFPLCMAAEESSHTLGLNRKSDSAAIPLLPCIKYCVVQQNHGALELFGFTVFISSTPAREVHILEALQHTLQSQHLYCSCSRFSTTKLAWQDGFPIWSHWLPLSLSLPPGLSPVGTSHGLLCVCALCVSVTRDLCFPSENWNRVSGRVKTCHYSRLLHKAL